MSRKKARVQTSISIFFYRAKIIRRLVLTRARVLLILFDHGRLRLIVNPVFVVYVEVALKIISPDDGSYCNTVIRLKTLCPAQMSPLKYEVCWFTD